MTLYEYSRRRARARVSRNLKTNVFYTEIPLKGPSGLSVNRTEATVAVVMWEPLSTDDLRGNLSSYEIVYYEVIDEQSPQNMTILMIRQCQ